MMAITLTQPWAYLACEFDPSPISVADPADYRGRFAVHAAGRRAPFEAAWEQVVKVYGKSYMDAMLYCGSREVPLGAIVAVGTLVDCVPAQTIKVGHRGRLAARGHPSDGPLRKRDLVGTPLDNHAGRWMLIVEGLRVLDPAVRCRGRAGLWTVPDDVCVEVAA